MVNNKIIEPNSIINFDFNQKEINSKIDTGAETNSLHSNNFFIKNGNLHCELLDHPELIMFKNYKIKHVKSSNGLKNKRYCVKLKFKIDGQPYESEFTLNDRSNMEYPVLIGKKFLNDNNFLVDVSKPYTELKEEKYLVRTFSESIDDMELVWHRDMEDRIVKSLGDTDWMIQMDDELPRPLIEMVYIPKNTYHRVIKGTGDLKVRINKLT